MKLPLVHVYTRHHEANQDRLGTTTLPHLRLLGTDVHLGRRPVRNQPLAPRPSTAVLPPQQSNIKAVIWDLDNTLAPADSVGKELYEPAFQAVREANSGQLNEKQLQESFQACWHTAFHTVAAQFNYSDEMTKAGAAAFDKLRVPQNSPYKGYSDMNLVSQLPMQNHLVTSGFTGFQNSKIDKLGIRDMFDSIRIDDPTQHYPNPSPGKAPLFQQIKDAGPFESSEVMVVGDNPGSEIAAGKALGMPTVQVLRPGVAASAVPEHKIDKLSQLWEVLHLPPRPEGSASQ